MHTTPVPLILIAMWSYRPFILGMWLLTVPANAAVATNDRPIIGILTEPYGAGEIGNSTHNSSNRTYIAASYVKFAESAGARVVPLHYDASDAELRTAFSQINGIIFPGGGANVLDEPGNRFHAAGKLLFDLAVESNIQGDPFPIFGICLGFQLLSVLVAQSNDVLCLACYETEGTPLPLNFTQWASGSKLFADMPAKLRMALTTENITENSHQTGVLPEVYENNTNLKSFFNVLSTNTDPINGKDFVSTVEGRNFPISATQWHPEKNTYEWGKVGHYGFEAIPHSVEAVHLTQHFANYFVETARLNSHRFTSEAAETEALIYNFAPVPDPGGYFAQIYVFEQPELNVTAHNPLPQPKGYVLV